ncbi:TOM (translocase of outer membrane) complex component [Cladochytrium tenue]|nr:TOM (translocase of outer membrane) complex component [Cladochytrium tenue]
MALESTSRGLSDQQWRTLAIALASVAVAGGVSYLVYSVTSSTATTPTAKAPGKSKKGKKVTRSVATTPVVDETETKPKATTTADDLLTKDASVLGNEERTALAKEAKSVGNKLFGEKSYEDAVKYYTRAIELSPDAIYFANRAACYANLGKNEDVIEDCTKALELDPRYVKAIYRRAQAYTLTEKLEEALKDYTSICMLEEFKKESSIQTTDRILKDIGKAKTDEMMKTKTPRLPSDTFVKAYNGASIVAGLSEVTPGDSIVKKAFALLLKHEWDAAMALITEALDHKLSHSFELHALNLSGTFAFLRGEVNKASDLYEKALEMDPKNVNVCIKRASIFMERGDLESAIREYERAEGLNKKDPDVYYHRGQIRFLTGDLASAISDYRKSLSLDDNFVYAHIQLAVALYKDGNRNEASNVFKKAENKFADSPEVSNYYGEILMDQELFDEALESFDKSIAMNPKSPLPYINKAILYLQWKKDAPKAEELCRKATDVDPLCDIAYIQLSQLLIHQNRLSEALATYDQAIAVTRTEPELMNAISCREACAAQIYVSELYPDIFAKLRASGGLA